MANYNTFVAVNTKTRKPVLVTSSARKVAKLLMPGIRIEVWNENKLVETLYTRVGSALQCYIAQEKEYIRNKQAMAEKRNKKRRDRRET